MFSFCISLYWIRNFFISVNLGIAIHSEAAIQHTKLKDTQSWRIHQVEGYTEQEKPRDIVELARDNIFDTFYKHDKYIVLKKRSVPEANFDFPKAIKHGCNYLCKTAYLSDSFVCSCQDNAVYCIYCVLFCPQRQTEHIGCICESWIS